MNLKFGVWPDYEKKNRVRNFEVQKMPGRPIRRHLKEKWEFARVGPRDRASQKTLRGVGGPGLYRDRPVFFFGKKSIWEGVMAKTFFCRVHSARPLLICNLGTFTIEINMEKVIKLGGMNIGSLFE